MALTKDFIVEKSIGILNRDGIEGLTMRLLARELDIKAASLYWHFSDKAELYAAISERLSAEMTMPVEGSTPTEALSSIFSQFREILLRVRDSVSVFENSAPFTPKRLEIIREVSNRFLTLGVKSENLVTVSNMFNNYVLSFVADECRFKKVTTEQSEEFSERLSPQDRLIFAVSKDSDGQFAYGLHLLFCGLEQIT